MSDTPGPIETMKSLETNSEPVELKALNETDSGRSGLVEQQKQDMAYQKSEDRPAGPATKTLGRPEIVDDEGNVVVKGKQRSTTRGRRRSETRRRSSDTGRNQTGSAGDGASAEASAVTNSTNSDAIHAQANTAPEATVTSLKDVPKPHAEKPTAGTGSETAERKDGEFASPAEQVVEKSDEVARSAGAPKLDQLKNGEEFVKQFFHAEPGQQSLFDRVNKDGDGKISMNELQLALINSDYKGKDAQALATFYRMQVVNQELLDKHHEGWGEYFGRKVAERTSELVDGYPLRYQDGYEKLSFSKEDIEATGKKQGINFALKETSFHSDGRLWGKGKPEDSIRPEAITQGAVGDCHLLSTMMSMANTQAGREHIADMIEPAGQSPKGDPLYKVTFADPNAKDGKISYTVSGPTDSELALYAKDTGHGTWPNVLEKAYAQYRKDQEEYQDASYFAKTGRRYRPLTFPVHEAGMSGEAEKNMPLFTGKSADKFDISEMKQANNPKEVREAVHSSLKELFKDGSQSAVTAMVPKEPKGADGYSADAGLVTGHEYTILGYDPKSGQLTIRNPHGENHSREDQFKSKDGTFKMSLDRFINNYGPVRFTKDLGTEK